MVSLYKLVRFLVLLLSVILGGCLYTPFSSSTCKDNCPPQLFASQGKRWSEDSITKVSSLLVGFLESTVLGNHKAIWVEVPSQKLVLSMPSPNVFINNWSAQIAELPGTQIRAYVDSHEHSFVEVRFPLYLLTEKFENYKEKFGLPNGDLLPGIPQGKLAKIDIQMDKNFQAHLFFGEGVIGLLVDVPYDPMLKTSLPIKRAILDFTPENILGYVSTVPKESLNYGGIFMSIVIPVTAMEILGK